MVLPVPGVCCKGVHEGVNVSKRLSKSSVLDMFYGKSWLQLQYVLYVVRISLHSVRAAVLLHVLIYV